MGTLKTNKLNFAMDINDEITIYTDTDTKTKIVQDIVDLVEEFYSGYEIINNSDSPLSLFLIVKKGKCEQGRLLVDCFKSAIVFSETSLFDLNYNVDFLKNLGEYLLYTEYDIVIGEVNKSIPVDIFRDLGYFVKEECDRTFTLSYFNAKQMNVRDYFDDVCNTALDVCKKYIKNRELIHYSKGIKFNVGYRDSDKVLVTVLGLEITDSTIKLDKLDMYAIGNNFDRELDIMRCLESTGRILKVKSFWGEFL